LPAAGWFLGARKPDLGESAELAKILESRWHKLAVADTAEAKKLIEEARQESTKAAAYRSYLATLAESSPDPARRLVALDVLDRPTAGDSFNTYLQQMAREHPDPMVRARANDVLNTIDD
jgi:hypothetical protein